MRNIAVGSGHASDQNMISHSISQLPQCPIIIAHRGASGERPEHTLAAYERAIEQGADYIEPDLVMTKDGVLIARHDNDLSQTTNIADLPQFANRKTTKTIDGIAMTGWFSEDFTWDEIKTLRAKERLPQLRPKNSQYDGLYAIPRLEDILALITAKSAENGRTIGIYPEIKHPSYFAALGLPMEEKLVTILDAAGAGGDKLPVYIQSFEITALQQLNAITEMPLVFLMSGGDGEGRYGQARFTLCRIGDQNRPIWRGAICRCHWRG